jgi:conjugative transfer pilus assembly protein TraH
MMQRYLYAVGMLLALLFAAPSHAQSGVAQQSNNVFNSMTNVTDPKMVMGARRGVITGGGITVKNRMMNVNLIAMNAPTVTAGCGGIDAFMGSFSFISKDSLVAALRSIASAAVGYAFKLALQSMCPSCEKIMGEMQNMMNNVTMNNINSCEVGQAIVNAGGDNSIASSIDRMGAPARSWLGQTDDSFSAKNQNKTNTPVRDLASKSPQVFDQMISGNVIWRMLKAQSVGSWLGQQDDTTLEDVMSLTGTIIVCMPQTDASSPECAVAGAAGQRVGQDGVMVQYRQPAVISLKDLVEGTDSAKGVKRIRCVGTDPHGLTGCNKIVVEEYSSYEGLRAKVLKIMLGDGSSGNGLIDALATGSRAPTAQEEALITGGGQYAQIAINLAERSPTAAKQFATTFADLIAAELAQWLIVVDIDAALTAVAQRTNGDTGPARDLLREAIVRNNNELQNYYESAKSKSGVLDYFRAIGATLERRDVTQRPVGAIN